MNKLLWAVVIAAILDVGVKAQTPFIYLPHDGEQFVSAWTEHGGDVLWTKKTYCVHSVEDKAVTLIQRWWINPAGERRAKMRLESQGLAYSTIVDIGYIPDEARAGARECLHSYNNNRPEGFVSAFGVRIDAAPSTPEPEPAEPEPTDTAPPTPPSPAPEPPTGSPPDVPTSDSEDDGEALDEEPVPNAPSSPKWADYGIERCTHDNRDDGICMRVVSTPPSPQCNDYWLHYFISWNDGIGRRKAGGTDLNGCWRGRIYFGWQWSRHTDTVVFEINYRPTKEHRRVEFAPVARD